MRKKYSAALKFKIALEALSGRPIVEICKKYSVGQSMVHRWKDQLKNEGLQVFGEIKNKGEAQWEREQEKLYQRIGQLSMELAFLKKVVGE